MDAMSNLVAIGSLMVQLIIWDFSLLKNISLTLYNKIIGIAALDQKGLIQINKN
jgi:hypothetical protein